MGSSGGGSSGKVEYPAYLQTMHGKMMDTAASDTLNVSMFDLLNEATTTNPYNDASLVVYTGRAVVDTNGTETMTTIAQAVAAVLGANAGLDVIDYFNSTLTSVTAQLDAVVINDAIVDQATAAFEAVIDPGIQVELTKYDADATSIGMAMSSAYAIGKNLILARKLERIGTYDAELRSRMYLQRNDAAVTTARELLARKLNHIQVTKEVYAFAAECVKLKILNEREYFKDNAEFLHEKATWKFEAMQYGFNGMASIGGGSMIPKNAGMSKGSSAMAGALGGAAAGAYIGSVVPGVGTAAGAVVGGLIGGLGGFLG